jgi:hypothetical protein
MRTLMLIFAHRRGARQVDATADEQEADTDSPRVVQAPCRL